MITLCGVKRSDGVAAGIVAEEIAKVTVVGREVIHRCSLTLAASRDITSLSCCGFECEELLVDVHFATNCFLAVGCPLSTESAPIITSEVHSFTRTTDTF